MAARARGDGGRRRELKKGERREGGVDGEGERKRELSGAVDDGK